MNEKEQKEDKIRYNLPFSNKIFHKIELKIAAGQHDTALTITLELAVPLISSEKEDYKLGQMSTQNKPFKPNPLK